MSDAPPPAYVAYPRGPASYGSAAKLQALGEGYYGLNWVFLANIVAALVYRGATYLMPTPAVVFGGLAVLFAIVVVLTYPFNNKIAFGKGWRSGGGLASFLMGLNSILCCGILGYVIMQQLAANEMKNYGLRAKFLGVRKKDWKAAVEALEQAQSAPAPATMAPPPAQDV